MGDNGGALGLMRGGTRTRRPGRGMQALPGTSGYILVPVSLGMLVYFMALVSFMVLASVMMLMMLVPLTTFVQLVLFMLLMLLMLLMPLLVDFFCAQPNGI